MLAIAVAIGDIVDEIDDSRQRAEDRECRDVAVATAETSNSFSAKISAAKTSRFLVHWPGRSEMSRLTTADRRSAVAKLPTGASGTVRLGDGLRAI